MGKLANCQVAVSLHRVGKRAGESRPLSWRLYLPEAWTADAARRRVAGIPAEVTYQSKTNLALVVNDEALGWGAYPGLVLADEAYGGSFERRAALRERHLRYAVRVPWTTTAWTAVPVFEAQKLTARGRRTGPARWGPSRKVCARSSVACRRMLGHRSPGGRAAKAHRPTALPGCRSGRPTAGARVHNLREWRDPAH